MTHQVFLSYKREDEPRAARLAQALERHGLSVWWDRGLPGGESWHSHIEAALEAAGCVVVLWSEGSVGPAGQYVRDEARRALERRVMVPVLIDKVPPPLGFGEVQAVDLTHWRGKQSDPFLLDLVAAVRAKLEGRAVPAAKGPAMRWARRFTAGSAASGLLALAAVLGADLFQARERICSIDLAQPSLSDLCGSLGLGNRPTKAERLAWASRAPGSCANLRDHVARFPAGAYRSTAADLLTAVRIERAEMFTPAPREARGYVRQSENTFASELQARADATQRAQADAADLLCVPRDPNERLQGVSISPVAHDCRTRAPGGGTTCSLDYRAVCSIEVRAVIERCG